MNHSKLIIVLVLVCLFALVFPLSTLADAAPPDVPNGENIDPGEGTTMVQMVAEEVIIDVSLSQDTVFTDINGFPTGGYIVAYKCTFWLQNKGTETENLAVRFPINNDYEYGKINIHSIKVNGHPVSWVEDEVGDRLILERFNWAHFNVVFPPGEEVEVKITYTSVTYGWYGASHHRVSYILETGAGWYGPIEKGKIILRFPYQATKENVILAYTETPEGIFNDSDVYWEFTNLEPTNKDNWEVQIVAPDLWLEILAERKRLESSPNNFSALYRLANFIYTATIYKGFEIYSDTLYQEGLGAIEKAVRLNPENIESLELYTLYLRVDGSMESYLTILEQVELILQLDPENRDVEYSRDWALSNLERFQSATANANVPSTPTPTPVPTAAPKLPTQTPTIEPAPGTLPTQVATRMVSAEVHEEPPAGSAGILALGLILLILGGTAVFIISKKKT